MYLYFIVSLKPCPFLLLSTPQLPFLEVRQRLLPRLQLAPAAVHQTGAWRRSLGMRASVMSCVARTEGILQAFFGGDSRPAEIV